MRPRLPRHRLLRLDERAWQRLLDPQDRWGQPWPELADFWHRAGQPPALVCRRREGEPEGFLTVAWSFWQRPEGVRLGASALVPRDAVSELLSPYALPAQADRLPAPMAQRIADIAALAAESGVAVGLFGSVALATVTGLPYLHADSDIDLLLRGSDLSALRLVWEAAQEKASGCRLDAEIEVGDSQVKAAELFGSALTVLLKSADGVRLEERSRLLALIDNLDKKES